MFVASASAVFEAGRLKGTRGQTGGWGGLFVERLVGTSSLGTKFEMRPFKSVVFPKPLSKTA